MRLTVGAGGILDTMLVALRVKPGLDLRAGLGLRGRLMSLAKGDREGESGTVRIRDGGCGNSVASATDRKVIGTDGSSSSAFASPGCGSGLTSDSRLRDLESSTDVATGWGRGKVKASNRLAKNPLFEGSVPSGSSGTLVTFPIVSETGLEDSIVGRLDAVSLSFAIIWVICFSGEMGIEFGF